MKRILVKPPKDRNWPLLINTRVLNIVSKTLLYLSISHVTFFSCFLQSYRYFKGELCSSKKFVNEKYYTRMNALSVENQRKRYTNRVTSRDNPLRWKGFIFYFFLARKPRTYHCFYSFLVFLLCTYIDFFLRHYFFVSFLIHYFDSMWRFFTLRKVLLILIGGKWNRIFHKGREIRATLGYVNNKTG